MFKQYEDCTMGKAKQCAVSKKAVPCLKLLGERLFFDISSPSTPTFGSKWHWLLVIDDSSNYIWSFFLKEKSNLADAMVVLIKNLKNKYNLQVQFLHCDMQVKIKPLNEPANRKGWGLTASIQPQVCHNRMAMSN